MSNAKRLNFVIFSYVVVL